MQKNDTQILAKIEHLSEEEKLSLFKVEELETRLEMAAAAPIAEIDANGVCWIG
ncbi:hypothetical protein [Chitinophaga sp. MM2321]|uniref:hypothetical protein n=1 Tax=Chitinophaga sp. MM2321 TaxID=3137178 RepID=UPI0032D59552